MSQERPLSRHLTRDIRGSEKVVRGRVFETADDAIRFLIRGHTKAQLVELVVELAETTAVEGEPVPFDEADNMCPNCVTPWKCNGPHLHEQTKAWKLP